MKLRSPGANLASDPQNSGIQTVFPEPVSLSNALFHVGFVPRQALPTPWQMVTFSSRSTWPKSATSVERVSDLEYEEPTLKSSEGWHTKGEAFGSSWISGMRRGGSLKNIQQLSRRRERTAVEFTYKAHFRYRKQEQECKCLLSTYSPAVWKDTSVRRRWLWPLIGE